MGKLKDALTAWSDTMKLLDKYGRCCYRQHAPVAGEGWYPDEKVCLRERAWRAYVRLRDGNVHFPFVPTPWHQTFPHSKITPIKGQAPTVSARLKQVIEIRRCEKTGAVLYEGLPPNEDIH